MARGATVEYTLKGNAGGLVAASAQGVAAMDKLGGSASRVTERAAKFADGMGKVSTTLARSAGALGISAEKFRALDDVMDVVELGMGNAAKATAGFNVQTFAVVGAAAAAGYAVGTLIRQYTGLGKVLDDLAMKQFGAGPTGTAGMGGASHFQARQRQIEDLRRAGQSDEQILGFLRGEKGKTWQQEMEAGLEKSVAAQKKATEEAKRAAEERRKYLDVAGQVAKAEEKIRLELELQRKTTAYLADAKEFLWQRGGMAGQTLQDVTGGAGPATSLGAAPLLGLRGFDLSDTFKGGLLAPPLRVGRGPIDATGLQSNVGQDTEQAIVSVTTRLSELRAAMELLGVGASSTLGRVIGSIGVFSASLDGLKNLNKGKGGLLAALTGGQGTGAFLGAASGVLGIAGAAVGLFKGIFGGGPSKEEREAARQKAEQERQRIQSEAKAMRARGIEGLATAGPEFFMQRTITSADEAARQGSLFAAAWGQVVKEKGIVAAAAAFKDAFAKMKADIEAAGIEAPAWLTAIGGEMELGTNDAFKALAESAHTAAEFLKAFAESGGVLTPDTLRAFEQEARNAFQGGKDIAAGLGKDDAEATKAGFAAANPILQELLNQSIISGQTLSSDIDALIKQAGIVPDVDVQTLDETRKIRAAVEQLAGTNWNSGGNGNNNGNPPDWVENIPQYAGGHLSSNFDEFTPRGRGGSGELAVIHPDSESIVPDEDAEDFAHSVLGGSSTSGSVSSALSVILAEVKKAAEKPQTFAPTVQIDARGATENTVSLIDRQIRDRLAIERAKNDKRYVRKS